MTIFRKDKPAGDTQPEQDSPDADEIVAVQGDTIAGDDCRVALPDMSHIIHGGEYLDALEWVTLKTNHTHAGVEYQAGARILVSPHDVATLKHLGVID